MKKALLIPLILFVVAFGITGCKKCIVCKNVCYDCGQGTNILCSSDYPSQASFDALVASVESTGRTCTLTTPTKSFDVCDNKKTVKNFQNYYEQLLYKCQDK